MMAKIQIPNETADFPRNKNSTIFTLNRKKFKGISRKEGEIIIYLFSYLLKMWSRIRVMTVIRWGLVRRSRCIHWRRRGHHSGFLITARFIKKLFLTSYKVVMIWSKKS